MALGAAVIERREINRNDGVLKHRPAMHPIARTVIAKRSR
jgi:hypothetical protein